MEGALVDCCCWERLTVTAVLEEEDPRENDIAEDEAEDIEWDDPELR